MTKQHIEFLKQIPIFDDFSEDQLRFVNRYIETEHFEPGQKALIQGKKGKALYMIKTGEFKVSSTLPGDYPRQEIYLRPKEFFGEISMLLRHPSSSTISATKASQCEILHRDKLNMFRIFDPMLGYKIEHAIAKLSATRINTKIQQLHDLLVKVNKVESYAENLPFEPIDSAKRKLKNIDDININQLKGLEILHGISHHELYTLLTYLEAYSYERGYVFPVTETSLCGIILQGAMQLLISYDTNLAKNIDVKGPGEIFGPNTLFQSMNHHMQTVIREEALILVLQPAQLNKMKSKHEKLWIKVNSFITRNTVSFFYIIDRQLVRIESEYSDILWRDN